MEGVDRLVDATRGFAGLLGDQVGDCVDAQAPDTQPHLFGDALQRASQLSTRLAGGLCLPCVDRLEQRRQEEQATRGACAARGGCVGRLHTCQG
ncbi:MAG: hypothetical protein H0U86_07665 [Chloroflexi bacterium]|nr:hypothetical protein [Chloroflexota bacterium]